MQKIFLLLCIGFMAMHATAQHTFKAVIKDKETGQPLPGITVAVRKTTLSAASDSSGQVILAGIPAGKQTVLFTGIGVGSVSAAYNFPLTNTEPVVVEMEAEEDELEEVIVRSTRTSRNIKNVPTRVETITAEEVDEKNNMRPANVSMLLHESTGIQVQQTSATSASAAIRIQGLDGRYSQLLKDGFPNYGGFAGSLSVLEIPPLDLQQVEIIKGPASTLYGGGAIAGVVNFISKEPGEKNYTNLLVNQSNIGQTNLGLFTAQKKNKLGFTMLALANFQQPYDVDKDDFTELPQSKEFTIVPRLFWYINEKTRFDISHNFTTGHRTGGDIFVIKDQADPTHTYFETNNSVRNITNVQFEKTFSEKAHLEVKQSVSFYTRSIRIPGYRFKGTQQNIFTDISYRHEFNKHTLIGGGNFIDNRFREDRTYSGVQRNEQYTTAGFYLQDTWRVGEKISFENGLRVDVVNQFGAFVLPRISVLYKIDEQWSSRIGAGLGYKLPTLFTEAAEAMQFRQVLSPQDRDAEKSIGITGDVNFRKRIGAFLELGLNQLFFYTQINDPLVLQAAGAGAYSFINATKPVQSYGFETNARLVYRQHWKLFMGYTFNETKARYASGSPALPIVPKHKLNTALIYEKHDALKVGLEAYYTGTQRLSNGNQTSSFWEVGLMAEKPFKWFSIYINAENITDVRQSRYKRVPNGPHNDPSFDEIWTHTEGFVLNGGVKIRL
jgi:outer membrane receptor for ferrienterochelin and colicins